MATKEKKIVAIGFGFENVEGLRFDIDAFEYTAIRDVRMSYIQHRGSDKLEEHCWAEDGVVLLIKKEANDNPKYHPTTYKKLTPFQRLKIFNDIVSLELIYDDGTSRYVYVPYDGDSCEESSLQSVWETEEGNLLVKVRALPEKDNVPDKGDEVRFTSHPDNTELAIAEIHQKIRDSISQDISPEECDTVFNHIHGAIKEVNQRIGKAAFPECDTLKEAEAVYERIRDAALKMIGEWKGKRLPIFDKKWELDQKRRVMNKMLDIDHAFEQFLRLLDEEIMLERLCIELYDDCD